MDIALDKVCELILRARAVDVKEGVTDPDSGSNGVDDGMTDVLIDTPDDPTEEEVREVIAGMNDDERNDLVAILWIGRGDFDADDWSEALRTARDRDQNSTADYLLGIPNLGDLLDEGLAALGRSCA